MLRSRDPFFAKPAPVLKELLDVPVLAPLELSVDKVILGGIVTSRGNVISRAIVISRDIVV